MKQELFEKAKKIPASEYKGPVLVPWYHHSTEFYASLEDFLDVWDEDLPEYVWACYEEPFSLDMKGIVFDFLNDEYEDARDLVSEELYEELQSQVDAWIEKAAIPPLLVTDYRRAVILNE